MTLAATGAILAGLVLAAAAIKALPTIWRFLVAAGQAPLVIQRVAQEFSPNGGGSMRDAFDRMEQRFEEHAEQDRKNFEEIRNALNALPQP